MSGSLETALSFGDETAGRIVLRGHDLVEMAATMAYEEVAAILWHGLVDTVPTRAALGDRRVAAFERLKPVETLLVGQPAAAVMRMLIAGFVADGPDAAIAAVAHIGVSAALALRAQQALPWLAPDRHAGHVADLLTLATGKMPSAAAARAFECYCVLMIDHGINASTYAARIAASTGAGLDGSILAALATLQGPRHGGAPSLVLDQLDAIAGPGDVPRFVRDSRAAGQRLIGFGSRAYRGRDLRADLLKHQWRAIGGAHGARADAEAIEVALVEELAKIMPERGLRTNVEYYAALLLEAVGLPRVGMTPMFAAARAPGWVAHSMEQSAEKRIIRPISQYTGTPHVAPDVLEGLNP